MTKISMLAKMSRSWLFFFSCLLLLAVIKRATLRWTRETNLRRRKGWQSTDFCNFISQSMMNPLERHYSITLMKISGDSGSEQVDVHERSSRCNRGELSTPDETCVGSDLINSLSVMRMMTCLFLALCCCCLFLLSLVVERVQAYAMGAIVSGSGLGICHTGLMKLQTPGALPTFPCRRLVSRVHLSVARLILLTAEGRRRRKASF